MARDFLFRVNPALCAGRAGPRRLQPPDVGPRCWCVGVQSSTSGIRPANLERRWPTTLTPVLRSAAAGFRAIGCFASCLN